MTLFKRGKNCLVIHCFDDQHCHDKNCMNGCDTGIERCFSNDASLNLPYYHKNFGKDPKERQNEEKKKQDTKSMQPLSSSRTSPSRKTTHS